MHSCEHHHRHHYHHHHHHHDNLIPIWHSVQIQQDIATLLSLETWASSQTISSKWTLLTPSPILAVSGHLPARSSSSSYRWVFNNLRTHSWIVVELIQNIVLLLPIAYRCLRLLMTFRSVRSYGAFSSDHIKFLRTELLNCDQVIALTCGCRNFPSRE
jgi:hypothetical protein